MKSYIRNMHTEQIARLSIFYIFAFQLCHGIPQAQRYQIVSIDTTGMFWSQYVQFTNSATARYVMQNEAIEITVSNFVQKRKSLFRDFININIDGTLHQRGRKSQATCTCFIMSLVFDLFVLAKKSFQPWSVCCHLQSDTSLSIFYV